MNTEEFLQDAFDSARCIDAGEEMDDEFLLSLLDEAALARVLSETNLELFDSGSCSLSALETS